MALSSFQSKKNLEQLLDIYEKDYSLFFTILPDIQLRKKEKHKLFINLVSSNKTENEIIESLLSFSDKQSFSLVNKSLIRECFVNISAIKPKVFEFIAEKNNDIINDKVFFGEEFFKKEIKNTNETNYTITFNKGIHDKFEDYSYIYRISDYYNGSFVSNLSEYILDNISLIKAILLYDNNRSSLDMLFQAKDKSIPLLLQVFKELEKENKIDYKPLIDYINQPKNKNIDQTLINYILEKNLDPSNFKKLINNSIKELNFSYFEALTDNDSIYYNPNNADYLFDSLRKACFFYMADYYKDKPTGQPPVNSKEFYTQAYHSLLKSYPELIQNSFFRDSKKINNFVILANRCNFNEIASSIETIYLDNSINSIEKPIINNSKKRL
ncbi:TPA: hypothetical protein NV714_001747 [Escherichia coli]|nr:hypothetical protein [Escherichia coli]